MTARDHPELFFTEIVSDPAAVIARTKQAGLANAEMAEVAAWVWEMAAQVEFQAAEMGLPCVLMGGTGAQLRFGVEVQRGSRDVDVFIKATAAQVEELVLTLQARLANLEEPSIFEFKRYPPPPSGKRLQMVRWDTRVPNTTTGQGPHLIKLEFHLRTDRVPDSEAVSAQVFVFGDPVTHKTPLLAYQIALKLLVIRSEETLGAERRREAVLPRQFYDLDQLFAVVPVAAWDGIAEGVKELAKRESTRSDATWRGLHNRLDEWVDGLLEFRSRLAAHVGSYNTEIPVSQQIPLPEWRTRIRRLQCATRLAEMPGRGGSWSEALRIANSMDVASSKRLAARWAAEGGRVPTLRDTRPAALWWEYLSVTDNLRAP